jgi:SHS2 domain-containing protein
MADRPQARWEHFEHNADLGLRGIGATVEEVFVEAALALTAATTDPALVRPASSVRIACTAPDLALLLVDWLNALIYEMATRGMLFGRFLVTIAPGNRLEGEAWGEPVDAPRHQPAVEVKGATLTALRVARGEDGGWLAQCVVDV